MVGKDAQCGKDVAAPVHCGMADAGWSLARGRTSREHRGPIVRLGDPLKFAMPRLLKFEF